MITVLNFSIAVIVLLLYCGKKILTFAYVHVKLRKLPGPPNDFLLGNIGCLLNKPPEKVFQILDNWNKNYPSGYKLHAVPLISANIHSPEDFEKILSNPKHIQKSFVYDLLHQWLGTGLLTSTGVKWQTRRKILTPPFHFSILREFLPIMIEQTEVLVGNLKQTSAINPVVDVTSQITEFTLKSIAETAMGVKLNFHAEKEQEYKNAVHEISQVFLHKSLRPWKIVLNSLLIFDSIFWKEKRLVAILHKFTRNVIAQRQDNVAKPQQDLHGRKKRLAMLDLLLSCKNQEGIIDDEGIREEVDTFMFEGHDTTAMALSFTLMLISCHREVQEKIVAELQRVLGENMQRKATFNDLQEMKYLERCIKESLRLYPSVSFISRTLGEDLILNTGFLLPRGATTHLHIYAMHRNPEIFPDPEKFDPDRFLAENCQKRHAFAYVPFSAGPRNCIGQKFAILELKAAIAGILANFVLESFDTPDKVLLLVDILLRPKENIRIRFRPRKV